MAGTPRSLARGLTPQEEEVIKVSFDSFAEEIVEKDPGSGEITKKKCITMAGLEEAFQAIGAFNDIKDIQLLCDDMDTNGNGLVDEDEWRQVMTTKFLGENDDETFMHSCAMLDDNKDGYIPMVELRKMLTTEGQFPLSDLEVDELLLFADADSDGLINYREFLRWLSNPMDYQRQMELAGQDPEAGAEDGKDKSDSDSDSD